jgi:hypothetical protein
VIAEEAAEEGNRYEEDQEAEEEETEERDELEETTDMRGDGVPLVGGVDEETERGDGRVGVEGDFGTDVLEISSFSLLREGNALTVGMSSSASNLSSGCWCQQHEIASLHRDGITEAE